MTGKNTHLVLVGLIWLCFFKGFDHKEWGMEKIQQWVGKSEKRRDQVMPGPAARMAAALETGPEHPETGTALPALWHWMLFPEVARASDLGPDGHAGLGEFLPPVPLTSRMWAGGRIWIKAPLLVGDDVTRRSTILKVEEKTGRSGPLVFVTVQHDFSVAGEERLTEQHDIVYRNPPDGSFALPPGREPPKSAEWSKTITPNPVLLFQYSALTYNGHRIHYDVDYCRTVEGYPGLVVHGPLTATLLAGLAAENASRATISCFEFRALRPLFDDRPFTIAGQGEDRVARLWAVDPDGYLAMTAEAELDGQ